MNDSQQIMNGRTEWLLKLTLSGSLMFDVDESTLGGQSMEIWVKFSEDKLECRDNVSG